MMGQREGKSRKQMIRLFVFEVVFVAILCISAYFISLSHKIGYEKLDDDIYVANYGDNGQEGADLDGEEKLDFTVFSASIENEESADSSFFVNEGVLEVGALGYGENISKYRNILLVGVDARDQSVMTRGANADVMMIVSINKESGEIRLVSVLRDTLLRLFDGGVYYPDRLYDKANAQNCYTGISDTVSMLNMNLDLNIREYAVVNWAAAAEIVDTIGGIEMNIENEEILSYLNGYLTEVNQETGLFAPQLKETGVQMLTGTQAVSFCRIRYAGLEDSGRTNNQREVIVKILDKMKQLLFEKPALVMTAVNQAAQSVVTNLTLKEIGALAFDAVDFQIAGHCSFPFQYQPGDSSGRIGELTGGVTDFLVATDLETNVKQLHQFLYGDAASSYVPSDYVKAISEDIRWMAGDN
ncbi:MAG: LCP family protein [Lachnospiraceae bacterium]|nr:LCP family protein [Lachnospiraceae bacterium]